MKKLCQFFALFVAICLFFTACSPSTIISDKLQAPENTGELTEIQKAIKDTLGDVNFSYPRNGDFRSAVTIVNLDGKNDDEAVAFYTTATDDSRLIQHIAYVSYSDGKWNVSNDFEIEGISIHSVSFAYLENSLVKNIVLCVNSYTSKLKELLVFSIDGLNLKPKLIAQTNAYAVCDLDQNGLSELLTVELNSELKTSTAKLIKIDGDTAVEKSSCKLDGSATDYDMPRITIFKDGTPTIFIDATTPTGTLTEVISLKDGSLFSHFADKETGENAVTLRASTTKCEDYNKDGILEIPKTLILPQSPTIAKSDEIYLTAWQHFDGENLSDVATTVTNYTDGYMLQIPNTWLGTFSIVRNLPQKERIFYEWIADEQSLGTRICSIKVFSRDDWEAYKQSEQGLEYREITRTADYIYTYATGESPLALSLEQIQRLFKLVNVNGGIK